MSRPLFSLSPRLSLCARFIISGRPLWDVGTDHGYLPIWLLKTGMIPFAYASDLREGPLCSARENSLRYGVQDRICLFLGDGLTGFLPEEPINIVLAGMGGDTILSILEKAPWLRKSAHRLVLQPMSSADTLRRGLASLSFFICEERAVLEGNRPYTAFSAQWGEDFSADSAVFPYLGKLPPGEEATRCYAERVLRDLAGRLEGAKRGRGEENVNTLMAAMDAIRRDYVKGE